MVAEKGSQVLLTAREHERDSRGLPASRDDTVEHTILLRGWPLGEALVRLKQQNALIGLFKGSGGELFRLARPPGRKATAEPGTRPPVAASPRSQSARA